MKRTLFLVVLFVGYACTQPPKQETEIALSVPSELPDFTVKKLSGDTLSLSLLPGKTILILFNPGCDHCERQAEAIQREMDSFKNYQVYFMASTSPKEIKEFAEKYKLLGYPNVYFTIAKTEDVMRVIAPLGVPTILIYSSEKKLTKRFDTETDVKEVIKYLDLN